MTSSYKQLKQDYETFLTTHTYNIWTAIPFFLGMIVAFMLELIGSIQDLTQAVKDLKND
jgi:uncharacterized membrane protein YqhA